MLHISFLYFEDCPSHDWRWNACTKSWLRKASTPRSRSCRSRPTRQAAQWHFVGSPTILVEGRDIDPPPPSAQFGLTCRAYRREDGRISPLPPPELIRRGLRAPRQEDNLRAIVVIALSTVKGA